MPFLDFTLWHYIEIESDARADNGSQDNDHGIVLFLESLKNSLKIEKVQKFGIVPWS